MVTFIVFCENEADRGILFPDKLLSRLTNMKKEQEDLSEPSEVIFMCCGFDLTYQIISRFRLENRLTSWRVHTVSGTNRSSAFVKALDYASGDHIVVTTCSRCVEWTNLNDLKFKNNDCYVASRFIRGSFVGNRWSKSEVRFAKILRLFSLSLVPLSIAKDVSCEFILIPRDIANKLKGYLMCGDWCFETELIYLCNLYGVPIREFSVVWSDIPDYKHHYWLRFKNYKRCYSNMRARKSLLLTLFKNSLV